jgi:hypothetical protein
VLVCHSLGGLVAKQMLRAALDRTSSETWRVIGSNIRGVVFLATPHSGAKLASFITSVTALLGLPGLIARPTQSLRDLESDTPLLDQLSAWYRTAAEEDDIATKTYYETKPPAKIGTLVVSLASANPNVSKVIPIPVPLDHWQISKPRDRSSQVYAGVLEFIREQLSRERKGNANPRLALRLTHPVSAQCAIPIPRDQIRDVKEALDAAVLAGRLPSTTWVEAALADPGDTAHISVRNSYAASVQDWKRRTTFNLVTQHENQTWRARSVIVGLEARNEGRTPAKKVQLEFRIAGSSYYRVETSPRGSYAGLILHNLPVPPTELSEFIAGPDDLKRLKDALYPCWYDTRTDLEDFASRRYLTMLFRKGPFPKAEFVFGTPSFELGPGESAPIQYLFVSFGYKPAAEIELTFTLSAEIEDQPSMQRGSISVAVSDTNALTPTIATVSSKSLSP